MHTFKLTKVLVLLGGLYAGAAGAEIAVVGHPSLGVDALSRGQVKLLFLGKRSALPDGTAVTVVDQDEGRPVREAFSRKVLGKNATQMKTYWSRMIFSGKATPPKTLADDAAVRDWVARTPNGIGYLDAGAADASVKVLLKVP